MHKLFLKPHQAPRASKELNSGESITLFYMESCPHCIAMKPEWNRFAKQHSKNRKIVTVERAAMPPEFQSEIYSFPTVVLIKNGKIVKKHEGERSADSFDRFSNEISKKSLSKISKGASRSVSKRSLIKKTKRVVKK